MFIYFKTTFLIFALQALALVSSFAETKNLGFPEHLSILNKCQKISEKKELDVKSRGIISEILLNSNPCNLFKNGPTEGNSSVENLEKNIQDISKEFSGTKDTSKKLFKKANISSLSLLNNAMKHMETYYPEGVYSSKTRKQYLANYPLNKDPYKDSLKQNLSPTTSPDNKNVFDIKRSLESYEESAKKIDTFCKEVSISFKEKFQKKRFSQFFRRKIPQEKKKFIRGQTLKLNNMVALTMIDAKLPHIMGTENFKKNIFSPTVNHIKRCIDPENKKHEILKKLTREKINKSLTESYDGLLDQMNKIRNNISSSRTGRTGRTGRTKIESHIDNFLKDYPMVMGQLLNDKTLSEDEKNKMTAFMCKRSLEIYAKDKSRKFIDMAVGATAILAGSAAAMTGIGSPIGAALMLYGAGAIGAYGLSRSVAEFSSASKNQEAANRTVNTIETNSNRFKKFISKSKQNQVKQTSAIIEGVASLTPLVAIKVVKNMTRMKKSSPPEATPISGTYLQGKRPKKLPKEKEVIQDALFTNIKAPNLAVSAKAANLTGALKAAATFSPKTLIAVPNLSEKPQPQPQPQEEGASPLLKEEESSAEKQDLEVKLRGEKAKTATSTSPKVPAKTEVEEIEKEEVACNTVTGLPTDLNVKKEKKGDDKFILTLEDPEDKIEKLKGKIVWKCLEKDEGESPCKKIQSGKSITIKRTIKGFFLKAEFQPKGASNSCPISKRVRATSCSKCEDEDESDEYFEDDPPLRGPYLRLPGAPAQGPRPQKTGATVAPGQN